jgi:hypothetical protein
MNTLLSDFQEMKNKIVNQEQFEKRLIKLGNTLSNGSRDRTQDILIYDWLYMMSGDHPEVYDIFNQSYQIIMLEHFDMNSSLYILNVSHSDLLKIFDVCIKFAQNSAFS